MKRPLTNFARWNIAGVLASAALLLSVMTPPLLAQGQDDEDWTDWHDFKFSYRRSPTLSAFYGWTTPSFDGFKGDFARSGYLQVKIGGSTVKAMKFVDNIVDYKHEHLELAFIAPRLTSSPSPGEAVTETWRFGGATERGMGYGNPSSFSLVLFNGSGLNWSHTSVPTQALDPADSNILALYKDAYRFGTLANGGAKIRLGELVMFEGSYERSMVFPRHLFMKWVGSALIEVALQWGVDHFVDEVLKGSPAAAPVVNFVLKNGVSYGMYELRKKSMYWPFPSDPALLNDTWKVGVSMTF